MGVQLRAHPKTGNPTLYFNVQKVRKEYGLGPVDAKTAKKALGVCRAELALGTALLDLTIFQGSTVTAADSADSVTRAWESYIEDAQTFKRLRQQSIAQYRSQFEKWVQPAIGNIPPRRVTRDDIKTLLAAVVKSGAKQNTVKGVLRCVRRLFSWLIDEGRLKANDGRDLANPAARQGKNVGADEKLDKATGRIVEEVKPLTSQEQTELLKVLKAKGHREYTIALLGLRAGLRISEALGLQFDDVDFEARTLRVERQVIASTGEIGPLKTKAGYRLVDIYSDQLLTALRQQIAERKLENLRTGWRFEFLLVSTTGRTFTAPSWQGSHLRPGLVAAGLGKIVPDGATERFEGHVFHDLRHTYAIELYAATRDLKYVARQLGHGSTVITEGTYLRFFDAISRERRPVDLDATHARRAM